MTVFESKPLTTGNLKNNHIYITPFRDKLPRDAFGGNTKETPAPRLIRLEYEDLHTDTYVPSGKKGTPRSFFQTREFVGKFFEKTGADLGDTVLFEQVSPYHLRLSLRKANRELDGRGSLPGDDNLVATPAEYAAFFSTAISEVEKAMLTAHAKGGEMSMRELAEVVGYESFRPANAAYGRLGRRLAESYRLQPLKRRNGSPIRFSVLASWGSGSAPAPEAEAKSEFKSRLHQEVIEGLRLAGYMDIRAADASNGPQQPLVAARAVHSRRSKPYSPQQAAIIRMMGTAKDTARNAFGQQVLRRIKNKEVRILDSEFERHLNQLIEEQNGRCAITGLKLQFDGDHQDSQLLCSLDRIDSDKHYEIGNLQVVCRFINMWKSAEKDSEVRRLVALLRSGGGEEA